MRNVFAWFVIVVCFVWMSFSLYSCSKCEFKGGVYVYNYWNLPICLKKDSVIEDRVN